jgi:NTE family protein
MSPGDALASRLAGLWQRLRRSPPPRRLRLALQGGGSHGAFTWGVLDRLLEDERFEIEAISGTSAGALNAALFATGHAAAGRAGARRALADFWHAVSQSGAAFAPFLLAANSAVEKLPAAQWASTWLRSISPYDFNPLNLNPLRDLLQRHVRADALQGGGIELFVTATAVHSGRARVFSGGELGIDALLASACLPFLFQAVEIDGEPYWDGGYSGNPALYPLSEDGADVDLLLVKINPLERKATPRGSLDILERVSEIGFNASLLAELRALAATQRQRRSLLRPAGREAPRLHMIADEAGLARYAASSKLDTGLAFLEELRALGRHAASGWLERHAADVGVRSSLDIESVFFPPAGR